LAGFVIETLHHSAGMRVVLETATRRCHITKLKEVSVLILFIAIKWKVTSNFIGFAAAVNLLDVYSVSIRKSSGLSDHVEFY
jgi:hypothetical protein